MKTYVLYLKNKHPSPRFPSSYFATLALSFYVCVCLCVYKHTGSFSTLPTSRFQSLVSLHLSKLALACTSHRFPRPLSSLLSLPPSFSFFPFILPFLHVFIDTNAPVVYSQWKDYFTPLYTLQKKLTSAFCYATFLSFFSAFSCMIMYTGICFVFLFGYSFIAFIL